MGERGPDHARKELDAVEIVRKSGNERFRLGEKQLDITLLEFWQWYASDLVSNALRGVLVEFIVALALGCLEETRREWDAVDLETRDGIRVEVKSAAYLQTWKQHTRSAIRFSIGATRGWDAKTNTFADEKRRIADVYVFCLLAHRDKRTLDPLNLDQWEFYVLPTLRLDRAVGSQATIGLATLGKLGPEKVGFSAIGEAVQRAARAAD